MKVAIVDYGMGNLHSVLKSVQAAQALSNQNAEIYLTSRPEEVMAADKVIFPGQGAMPDCMSALKASGLGEAVSDGLKNKPFFGICVGAQLLFEHSEEGDTDGLGWFEGQVKRFLSNQTDAQGGRLKCRIWGGIQCVKPVLILYFKTLGRTSIFILFTAIILHRKMKRLF